MVSVGRKTCAILHQKHILILKCASLQWQFFHLIQGRLLWEIEWPKTKNKCYDLNENRHLAPSLARSCLCFFIFQASPHYFPETKQGGDVFLKMLLYHFQEIQMVLDNIWLTGPQCAWVCLLCHWHISDCFSWFSKQVINVEFSNKQHFQPRKGWKY